MLGIATQDDGGLTVVTFGGVALTAINSIAGATVKVYLYYLINPPSGANNIVVTQTTNERQSFVVASYSGVDQDNPIDASDTGSGTNTAQADITTTIANDWLVSAGLVASTTTSVTGATTRHSISSSRCNFADSNGVKPIDTYAIIWNGTGDAVNASTSIVAGPVSGSDITDAQGYFLA